jgi:hypothetical protein
MIRIDAERRARIEYLREGYETLSQTLARVIDTAHQAKIDSRAPHKRSVPEGTEIRGQPAAHFTFPDDWAPTEEHWRMAQIEQMSAEDFNDLAEHSRSKLYKYGFESPDKQFRRDILHWKRSKLSSEK